MKKKVFLLLVILLCVVCLTGCGKSKEETVDEKAPIETKGSESTEPDIELYSDDSKIVFESGNSKLVYYYSGDTITGYTAYVDYNDSATAKYAYNLVEKDESIAKYYTKGKYLVVEYAKSEYENLTTSEVRALYSYLDEIKK